MPQLSGRDSLPGLETYHASASVSILIRLSASPLPLRRPCCSSARSDLALARRASFEPVAQLSRPRLVVFEPSLTVENASRNI